MIIKKFVPCIYLYHEHAVRNLTDTTIVDTDPVRLADYYIRRAAYARFISRTMERMWF